MPSYLVECYLPRVRSAELAGAADRIRRAAEQLAAEGARIRYVRSTFVPGDELCQHVLRARSADLVGAASRRAGIEPLRIVEAIPVATNDPRGGTE